LRNLRNSFEDSENKLNNSKYTNKIGSSSEKTKSMIDQKVSNAFDNSNISQKQEQIQEIPNKNNLIYNFSKERSASFK
jgi:hypothetical protein